MLHNPVAAIRLLADMSILSRKILNIGAKLGRVLPRQPCLLCGALTDHRAWCDACDTSLPYLPRALCPVCALPSIDGQLCGRCLRRRPAMDRSVAAFAYAWPLDRLVHALKYGERLMLSRSLSGCLADRVEVVPDLLVPMPLFPGRLSMRGFNQSQELSRYLARTFRIPLHVDACHRVRDTPPQSTLGWKQRGQNVRKAFACSADLAGMHVAIVDDVMTSGASMHELAQVLRRAGAAEISAWVVARALPGGKKNAPRGTGGG